MKPERLLSKFSLFSSDTPEEQYEKLKSAFLTLLDRTKTRCEKYCTYRSSQERYAHVSDDAVPGLNERLSNIESSLSRVKGELNDIDKLESSEQKMDALKRYAEGLASTSFKNVFMQMLSGQVKKRWLPLAKEPVAIPKGDSPR